MPALSIPNTFVTGTQVLAAPWNENFDAIELWVNTHAIQKDASVAFTALPTIPTTTPSADGHVASRKFMNDSIRAKGDHTLAFSLTPGGNTDTDTSGNEADWFSIAASQAIPSWANKAIVDFTVQGVFSPSSAGSQQYYVRIASLGGVASYNSTATTNRRYTVPLLGEITVTSVAGTSVAIKLRSAGTALHRIDTSSTVVGTIRFYA